MGRRCRDSCDHKKKRQRKYSKLSVRELSARNIKARTVDSRFADIKCLKASKADVGDLHVERVEIKGQNINNLYQPISQTVRVTTQSESDGPSVALSSTKVSTRDVLSTPEAEYSSDIYYPIKTLNPNDYGPPTIMQSINFSNIALTNVEDLVYYNVKTYLYMEVENTFRDPVPVYYNPTTNTFVSNPDQLDAFLLENTTVIYDPVLETRSINIQPQTQLFTAMERHTMLAVSGLLLMVHITIGTNSEFLPLIEPLKSTPVYAGLTSYDFTWKIDKPGPDTYANTFDCGPAIVLVPSNDKHTFRFEFINPTEGVILDPSQDIYTGDQFITECRGVDLNPIGISIYLYAYYILGQDGSVLIKMIFTSLEVQRSYVYDTNTNEFKFENSEDPELCPYLILEPIA